MKQTALKLLSDRKTAMVGDYGLPGEKYPTLTEADLKDTTLRSGVYWITPEIANYILQHLNNNNRAFKPSKGREYTAAFRNGQWHMNGESVQVDFKGNTPNLQHRCYACIQSNLPFLTTVSFGVDPEQIDKGAAKSPGDDLGRWGVKKHRNMIAAALRKIWFYEYVRGDQNKGFPSSKEFEAYFYEHKDSILKASEAYFSFGFAQTKLFTSGLATAVVFAILGTKHKRAEEFLTQLATGENLRKGMPVHTLRQRLLESRSQDKTLSNTRNNTDEARVLALVFKVWEAFLFDETIYRLRETKGEYPLPISTLAV